MATSAQYTTTPIVEYAQVSTANTARDGTGTSVLIASGPAVAQGSGIGKRIAKVFIKSTVTTTAGMIRFFISLDGGTTKRLITEVPVYANTVGANSVSFETTVSALEGLVLQGQVSSVSCNLYASTEKAETFNIIVVSATY
jgi:hypothetical protein